MRFILLLFVLLSIFSFDGLSQTLQIVDQSNESPIADAFIYHENEEEVAYTDANGIAVIDHFPHGKILIQHPSFHLKEISYNGEDLKILMREKIISFSEVIVSANKWEQEEENISQQIMSVDKKTIQFQNPQTSADLLAQTGQVFVQKSQLGGGSPKIRGFAANSVLMVVDGVRMNNAIFRSGNLQNIINIDPNAIESTEVIFGPGSVIYGSDALGGVMDFHTTTPDWAVDQKAIFKANALARYSSAPNERSGHIDFSIAGKKLKFFHSSTFTAMDDLEAGSWRINDFKGEFHRNFYAERVNGEDQLVENENPDLQRFSGFDFYSTISKLSYRAGNNLDISYGFYFSTTSNIPRYDNLTETIRPTSDSLATAEWYYGPQKWQMHNLRVNYFASNSLFDQARLTLAYQNFEESRNDRDFGDERLRTRTEKVDMYSLALDFDKELSKGNLYYGIDFYHNDITSSAFRKNIETGNVSNASPRYPNDGSDFTSFAVYGNFVSRLSEKVVFNAGIRWNQILLKAKTQDSTALSRDASSIDLNNSALNGSIGLAINLNEENKISYHISSGFRAPNIDDIGKVFEVGNSIIVPNPDLSPEYSLSNEISYQRKTGLSLFRVVGFYSRLFDAIIDGPFELNGENSIEIDGETLEVFSKTNAGKAEIYGISLMYQAEIGAHWAISNTINLTEGRDLSNDEPLRHTTPIFGRSSLTFKRQKLRSEFYVEFNGNRGRSAIPSAEIDRKPYLYTENGTPGWYTLNIKSSYQINDQINTQFGIENIMDMHYRVHTSGISAPGRNFVLALRANI